MGSLLTTGSRLLRACGLGAARRKLGDVSGASIVLSLVIFGISAIFCVALVNAALSSAGNAVDQAADEQDFLAASSAARLIQDIVPGKVVKLTGVGGGAAGSPTCQVQGSDTNAVAVLQAMGDSLLPTGAGSRRENKTVTFQAGEDIPQVTVTLIPASKSSSYDVTALVRGDDKRNAMAVYFKGTGSQGGDGTNVSWEVDSVGKRPLQ